MHRLVVDPEHPDAGTLKPAVDVLAAGGVVAFPTDTLYGLAADPFNAAAVQRIFDIKGRDASKGLPLVAASQRQIERHLAPLPAQAARLAARFWPGPLTIVLPAPVSVDPGVTAGGATVAVRVPDHPVARMLCELVGRPLVATSANPSGEPATAEPEVVARSLDRRLDVMVDGGRAPGGAPSTIVDVTGPAPVLLRAGAIGWDEVLACLERS